MIEPTPEELQEIAEDLLVEEEASFTAYTLESWADVSLALIEINTALMDMEIDVRENIDLSPDTIFFLGMLKNCQNSFEGMMEASFSFESQAAEERKEK